MKKFLTVLLVVAVMFTFSFSTAMAYTVSEATAVFAQAYGLTQAKAITVDYDGKLSAQPHLDDPSEFVIDAATAQKGIEAAYTNTITTAGAITATSIAVNGAPAITLNGTAAVDVELLKVELLAQSDLNAAYKAAWDAYKTYLKGLVDKVDISGYSETADNVVAHDLNTYGSAAKAAAADVAEAKGIIDDEAYVNMGSYAALYLKVFGPIVAATDVTGGDVLYPTEVSSIDYSLVGAYTTKAQEAGNAATLAAQKAAKKAELQSNVIAFKSTSGRYKSAHDEAIEAFVKAKTYLIDNGTTAAELDALDLTLTGVAPVKNAKDNFVVANDGRDYIDLNAVVAKAEKIAASMKSDLNADGSKKYDDDDITDNLVTEIKSVLNTGAFVIIPPATVLPVVTAATFEDDLRANLAQPTAFQTPAQKAALKIALPTDNEILTIVRTGSGAPVTIFTGPKTFYDKEFDAALAAIKAYNEAIDAAEAIGAVDKAITKLTTDLAALKDDTTVDGTWGTVGATLEGNVSAYVGAKRAAAGEDIYVAWATTPVKYTAAPGAMPELMTWVFEKGARTKAEVEALYAEACKVVDGYTTAATQRAEAAKVVEMIKALPATVALADKDAVKAAKKAYNKLHADVKPFVTNVATLDKDVTALEKLEAYDVATKISKLPSLSKVTAADKEAVKAAKEAYDAYRAECTSGIYGTGGINHTNTYNFAGALANIQTAELTAIVDAVKALNNKKALGMLTADDLKAVQEAQAMIDAYTAEYADNTVAPQERLLAAITKDVNALATADAVKKVESVQLKVRSTVGKGYIKITWRFAKGDSEGIQYYEVYRSTKRNSGFKKIYTTKDGNKMTYKNTKNLKKGKTYFYKVRAVKVVNDVKYTSDWSNKAYRTAK